MNTATITLPWPVSVNAAYSNARKGRVKSRAYMNWALDAGWAIKDQRPDHFIGRIKLDIALERKRNKDGSFDKRKRDLSNYVKVIEDLLVTHSIIEDDSLVERLTVYWSGNISGAQVEITGLEGAGVFA